MNAHRPSSAQKFPSRVGRGSRVLALASVACLAVGATATAANAASPAPAPASGRTAPTRVHIPKGAKVVLPSKTVTVVLQLKGTPLATALATAKKNHTALSTSERAGTVTGLRAGQQRVTAAAVALGAKIRYTYSAALDGISVTVPTSALPKLAALPDVQAVLSTSKVTPSLENSDNLSNVPEGWTYPGGTGAGEVIGVIDTGIDFTHADFGGSGNPAAFTNASRTNPAGEFPTSKVIGGTDLVGDAYNPVPGGAAPTPDPVPLDCTDHGAFPHGTHVSGDAAGQGVLADGSTFTGPYNATTFATHSFKVYPGSAPEAKLRVYRVFGCSTAESSASSDVIAKAIDDAVSDGVDVINMSLGQTFAEPTDVNSVATANAVASGIPTVVAAGNEGHEAYALGSPASTPGSIAVGAVDAVPTFPGATITSGSTAIAAQLSNNSTELPVTAPLDVLKNTDGSISLGCDPSQYAGSAGKIVVAARGTCPRVARAQYASDNGAAAAVLVNSTDTFPPQEGDIPTTNGSGTVTIPFLGVKSSSGNALLALDGQSATLTDTGPQPSPTFTDPADFTSGGPNPGDSSSKPDVAAGGVSVTSAGAGTGTGTLTGSGTSFATPTTAGIVADVLAAHPGLSADFAKAAVDETANPTRSGYDPLLEGAGIANAFAAVQTQIYETTGGGNTSGLSFGYQQLNGAYAAAQSVTLTNTSATDATYNLAIDKIGGQYGATETITPTVTVPANGTAVATMTISLTAAQVAALDDAFTGNVPLTIDTLGGTIVATPATTIAATPTLSIPYRLVPRGISRVTPSPTTGYTRSGTTATTTTVISNKGVHEGGSDIYTWGVADGSDSGVPQQADIVDLGEAVTPLPGSTPDEEIDFAFDTVGRFSQPGNNGYEIGLDTNADGVDDYFVIGTDLGAVFTGTPTGEFGDLVTDANGNILDAFDAATADNSNLIVLPMFASDIGYTGGTIAYHVASTSSQNGVTGESSSYAKLDPLHPATNSEDFVSADTLAPGASRTQTLTADTAQQSSTPALGWLVGTFDDANGTGQLNEVPLGTLPGGPVAALPDASAPVALLAVGLLTGGGALALRRRRAATAA